MSGHATAEGLSLYLDAALPAAEQRQLEEHLEACPSCRERLDGLRLVVHGLARLPAAVPPEDLAARVGREIHLRRRPGGWRVLLEGGLPGPLLAGPPIHLLALVLALGAIVYLFAFGLARRAERPTRIVPIAAETVVAGSLPDSRPASADEGESRYLLGGRFRRSEGVWVEEGLVGRQPDARVAVDGAALTTTPEIVELAADPLVAQLRELGAPLRLRVADEVVEISFGPASPGE